MNDGWIEGIGILPFFKVLQGYPLSKRRLLEAL